MCEGLVLQNVSGLVPKQICWPFLLNVLGLLKLAGHLTAYDLAACGLSYAARLADCCNTISCLCAQGELLFETMRGGRELTCVNCKRGEA